MDQRYDQRRVRCGLSSRRTVVHIVPAAPALRQAANSSGERLSHLVAAPVTLLDLLDGAALLAANSFADARRLALHLHDERYEYAEYAEYALLALGVASALAEIAHLAHCGVEVVERVSAGGEVGK
jgi:hypothetical protein